MSSGSTYSAVLLCEIHWKMLSDFYLAKMAAVNDRYMLLLRRRLIYSYYRVRIAPKRLKQKILKFWVRDLYRERDEKGEFSYFIFYIIYPYLKLVFTIVT